MSCYIGTEVLQECQVCHYRKMNFENMDYCWKLDVPRSEVPVELFSLFQSYFKTEVMENDNQVDCSVCKKMQNTTRKSYIKKFPKSLFLLLKRYISREKIMTKVNFPEIITINQRHYCFSSVIVLFSFLLSQLNFLIT